MNESDELTRIICTALREKMWRVKATSYGAALIFPFAVDELVVRPGDSKVWTFKTGTVNLGKKRMAHILQAIEDAK